MLEATARRCEAMSLWRRKPGFLLLMGVLAIALSSFTPLYKRLVQVETTSMEQQETMLQVTPKQVYPAPTEENGLDDLEKESKDRDHQEEKQKVVSVASSRQDEPEPSPQSIPDVAWIMSYGGSGTSYTILNVEQLTNATTASNYGEDYDPCISLREDSPNGPYIRSPEKAFPPHFILTKTHCGGYCMDCKPVDYLHTAESFETACLTGRKHVDSNNSTNKTSTAAAPHVTYDRSIPRRALHLIRSPFDNLVGRMHLAVKHHARRGNDDANEFAQTFTTSIEGISAWCAYLDHKYAKQEAKPYPRQMTADPYVLHNYSHVPCHAEWYRYVQWHNLAYVVTRERLQIPVEYLYFDDYSNDWNGTTTRILQFLQVAPAPGTEPYAFVPGKTYGDVFTKEHAVAATQMVRDLALPSVWKLFKHFFEPWLQEYLAV